MLRSVRLQGLDNSHRGFASGPPQRGPTRASQEGRPAGTRQLRRCDSTSERYGLLGHAVKRSEPRPPRRSPNTTPTTNPKTPHRPHTEPHPAPDRPHPIGRPPPPRRSPNPATRARTVPFTSTHPRGRSPPAPTPRQRRAGRRTPVTPDVLGQHSQRRHRGRLRRPNPRRFTDGRAPAARPLGVESQHPLPPHPLGLHAVLRQSSSPSTNVPPPTTADRYRSLIAPAPFTPRPPPVSGPQRPHPPTPPTGHLSCHSTPPTAHEHATSLSKPGPTPPSPRGARTLPACQRATWLSTRGPPPSPQRAQRPLRAAIASHCAYATTHRATDSRPINAIPAPGPSPIAVSPRRPSPPASVSYRRFRPFPAPSRAIASHRFSPARPSPLLPMAGIARSPSRPAPPACTPPAALPR